MKKLFLLSLAAILMTACGAPDENVAKSKTAELIEHIKKHEYDQAKDYYSAEFNASETPEARAKKFEDIESAAGAIQSYEVTEVNHLTVDERDIIQLKYKVKCVNSSLSYVFVVGLDEGDHKILSHNISNM